MLVTIRVGQRWKRKADGLVAKVKSFSMEGFYPNNIHLVNAGGGSVDRFVDLTGLLAAWKPTREKCQ